MRKNYIIFSLLWNRRVRVCEITENARNAPLLEFLAYTNERMNSFSVLYVVVFFSLCAKKGGKQQQQQQQLQQRTNEKQNIYEEMCNTIERSTEFHKTVPCRLLYVQWVQYLLALCWDRDAEKTEPKLWARARAMPITNETKW